MSQVVTTQKWNEVAQTVVHALIGLISPNFRRVLVKKIERQWVVEFVLEKEDEFDTEEIYDYISALDSYDWDGDAWSVSVIATSSILKFDENENCRIVYWRRESVF